MYRSSLLFVAFVSTAAFAPRFATAAPSYFAGARIQLGDDSVTEDRKPAGSEPRSAFVVSGGTDASASSNRFQVNAAGGGGEFVFVNAGAEYKEMFTTGGGPNNPIFGTVEVTAAYAVTAPTGSADYANANLSLYNNRGQADSDAVQVENRASQNGTLTASITGDITFGFEVVINTGVQLSHSDTHRAMGHVAITSITVDGQPLLLGELPGDYNGDGVVDAADYVVWRKNVGLNTTLPNDSTPGVTQQDYDAWRSNYGRSAPASGSGLIGIEKVPEPATAVMLVMIGLAISTSRSAMRR
jgi:hypothetical protein